jgi:hypothetical protein
MLCPQASPGGAPRPLLASLFSSVVLALSPVRWQSLDEASRAQAEAELQPLSLPARLLLSSERFLGTPYGVSPLGEGEGTEPDADPRLRWDSVDCVTFVEETMALSLAHGPAELLSVLDSIRYRDGVPTYVARKHLMEADWLPANTEAGYVRDVTSALGGPDAVRAEKVLVPASWQSPTAQALGLPESAHATGTFPFGLLPLGRVLAHAGGFPSGTLLLVVREDGPSRITRVSHLGLVVQKGQKTYLRHATSVGAKAVVDEELRHFLLRQAKGSWRVVGVSLWEVRDPRAQPAGQSGKAGVRGG